MEVRVKKEIDLLDQLKSERTNWDNTWQTIAEYVLTRKSDFTRERETGTFLNTLLFDNTAQLAVNLRSSTLVSLLWNGGKYKANPNEDLIEWNSDNVEWLQDAVEIQKKELVKAKFDTTAFESELDEASFGSSYIFVGSNKNELGIEDGLNILLFQVKESYIEETVNNIVDTIYRSYRITTKQAVDEFGIENVSAKVKQDYENQKYSEKVEMLHVIKPRRDRDTTKSGNKDMAFGSVYMDAKNRKTMRESGFNELPFFVSRESKKNGEKYGRSPSMMAISDIVQLNKEREDLTVIFNRFADPSLGVFNESMTTNILDTSPGATNSFKAVGKIGNPIFDMVPTKGDPRALSESILALQQTINQFYGLDRLLDFNNTVQMTLGEAQLRNKIKHQSLFSTITKKMTEKYIPIIKRSFNILYRQGKLGLRADDPRVEIRESLGKKVLIIPEEIANVIENGEKPSEVFELQFYTPFEIEKKILENQTYLQIWNNAGLIAELTQNAEVFDNLDVDESMKLFGNMAINNKIFREQDEVEKIRADREAAIQQQQALQNAEQLSNINKNVKE